MNMALDVIGKHQRYTPVNIIVLFESNDDQCPLACFKPELTALDLTTL